MSLCCIVSLFNKINFYKATCDFHEHKICLKQECLTDLKELVDIVLDKEKVFTRKNKKVPIEVRIRKACLANAGLYLFHNDIKKLDDAKEILDAILKKEKFTRCNH